MSARGGRRNGAYVFVTLKLANDCPRCPSPRGRRCVKKVGDQWLPMSNTHLERRALRPRKGRDSGGAQAQGQQPERVS